VYPRHCSTRHGTAAQQAPAGTAVQLLQVLRCVPWGRRQRTLSIILNSAGKVKSATKSARNARNRDSAGGEGEGRMKMRGWRGPGGMRRAWWPGAARQQRSTLASARQGGAQVPLCPTSPTLSPSPRYCRCWLAQGGSQAPPHPTPTPSPITQPQLLPIPTPAPRKQSAASPKKSSPAVSVAPSTVTLSPAFHQIMPHRNPRIRNCAKSWVVIVSNRRVLAQRRNRICGGVRVRARACGGGSGRRLDKGEEGGQTERHARREETNESHELRGTARLEVRLGVLRGSRYCVCGTAHEAPLLTSSCMR
jgi:hypothetical protein